ncbi:MAG: DUF6491 family protein [Novosphingobium sp.]|nr:hypothetical protein [Novosphingobium sp.]
MINRIAGVGAVAMLAVSCAPYADEPEAAQSASSGRDCFFLSQVSGYTHAGKNKIHVSVGPSRTYEFETLGICPELDDAETLAFDPTGPGTICRGIDVDLIVPSTIGPRRCPVSMISRVEEKADQ